MANPEDDPWCHFGVRFAAEALASLKAALDPDNALHWGCRVIKHPDCCVLCALNENCQDLPMHANCRCKPDRFLDTITHFTEAL